MDMPYDVLDEIIKQTSQLETYVRQPYLDKEGIEFLVKELYKDNPKRVYWLEDPIEIKQKIKQSSKPWVYHYSLNLNWVLFFKKYYEYVLKNPQLFNEDQANITFLEESKETYEHVCLLKKIFDHVDGIMEDDNKIYIVKSDIGLIKSDFKKIDFI